ncbi:ribosome modulation factor [Saccharospirillum impatiens]|uniref:ribosome modulation factor n=1 Tax=Saccharospirillum impatiens TaxID=169438 RepID=UPI00040C78BD|nr:ribosome modulation factor [Saccharospirillum impatiens]
MKRQKRDPLGRAYQKGYMAGLEGRSKSLCPEGKPEVHQEWMNGWREGRSDQWDGFTGVRGVHRINEVLMPH